MAAIQNMPQSLRVWTEVCFRPPSKHRRAMCLIRNLQADWNEHDPRAVREKGRDARPGQKYCASKTLAEQAAWRFVRENKGKIGFDLAVINPPWVCLSLVTCLS